MNQGYWVFRKARDREFRRAKLTDVERALEDCCERSNANAARDPATLSLLEAQLQLHCRKGPGQALEFGRLLAVVKRRVGHGQFEGWVRNFAPFAPRTAARYIRIASQLDGEDA
jgi:hypothetical protein